MTFDKVPFMEMIIPSGTWFYNAIGFVRNNQQFFRIAAASSHTKRRRKQKKQTNINEITSINNSSFYSMTISCDLQSLILHNSLIHIMTKLPSLGLWFQKREVKEHLLYKRRSYIFLLPHDQCLSIQLFYFETECICCLMSFFPHLTPDFKSYERVKSLFHVFKYCFTRFTLIPSRWEFHLNKLYYEDLNIIFVAHIAYTIFRTNSLEELARFLPASNERKRFYLN